jgi:hypothetical protein
MNVKAKLIDPISASKPSALHVEIPWLSCFPPDGGEQE